ncbi:MAG: glycyl-radical enzyme activating protein [Spirochaetota bacterium]
MTEPGGVVFNIQSYSIHDGPGIRTVVFLKGCPLSCLWCSNPESQRASPELGLLADRCARCGACVRVCPNGAVSFNDAGAPVTDREKCAACGRCEEACPYRARKVYGRRVGFGELMEEIEKDAPFYVRSGGGVTFSGGEPTLQEDILLPLLEACRARYIHTAVETCGYVTDRARLDRLLAHIDLVLYDIKCMDPGRHRRFTGVSNQVILDNARYIASQGKSMIVRVPVIPGFNDSSEDMEAIGRFALSLISVGEVDLLPYHELGKAKYRMLDMDYRMGEGTLTPERVSELQAVVEGLGLACRVD